MQKTDEIQNNSEINISNIFQKKPSFSIDKSEEKQPDKETKPIKEQDKKEPPKKDKEDQENKNENDTDDDQNVTEEDDEEKETLPPKESVDHKTYEKLEKTLKETQKWGHQAHKQLSTANKKIQKFIEDGILTEDEAKNILDYSNESDDVPREKSFLEKAGEIWDKEISAMRKYSQNPQEIDQFIRSFQHFLHNGSHDNIKETIEQFEESLGEKEIDDVAFTKRMLEIGKQWNDEIYGDITEAGGIENLKNFYAEKEKKLQKTFDKLQKEYDKLKKQYADYSDNPNMGLPSGSSPDNPSQNADFNLGRIFSTSNRFKPR